eukprot:9110411-Prorocentrum_lima.AAC.1
MTSSLVGSEMCIRDRLPRPQAAPSQYPPGAFGSVPRQSRVKPMPHPVSYTHLTLPTICSV